MKKKNQQIIPNNSFTEFLLYTTPNGKVKVEIFLHNENIWLTQKLIALLFNCSTDNVSLHLKNIFECNELQEKSVTEEFSATASDGKKYKTKHYNLDAIISVGYRVNSANATFFRIWATERLKEYIIKGFTMDDELIRGLSSLHTPSLSSRPCPPAGRRSGEIVPHPHYSLFLIHHTIPWSASSLTVVASYLTLEIRNLTFSPSSLPT